MKQAISKATGLLLLIIVILSFSACKTQTANETDSLEGKGYETADEAAKAYAEAFCQSDIDSMLSTFAIETYIKNYNMKEYLSTRKYYDYYYAECPFENNGEFKTQINYYSRIFDLVKNFKQLYFYLVLKDNDYTSVETFTNSNSDYIESFINEINAPFFEEKVANAKIRRILSPEMLNGIDSLAYKNSITTKYSFLNCDEITSFAIEFDFNNNEYYLFVDVGRFDDVWYNLSISSSLGVCSGANSPFSIISR